VSISKSRSIVVLILCLSACQIGELVDPQIGAGTPFLPAATTQIQIPPGAPTDLPSGAVEDGSGQTASMPGCTLASLTLSEENEQASLFRPVDESDWILGPASAPVTIVEYGDFQ